MSSVVLFDASRQIAEPRIEQAESIAGSVTTIIDCQLSYTLAFRLARLE